MQPGDLESMLEGAGFHFGEIQNTSPDEAQSCSAGLNLNNIDNKLAEAFIEVLASGNLTPLIKEELKTKIQANRLKTGKEELKIEFEKEKKFELSPDEKQRILKRKEANRLAAIRFRHRRKSKEQELVEECENLEKRNAQLLKELSELQKEKSKLLECISCIKSPP